MSFEVRERDVPSQVTIGLERNAAQAIPTAAVTGISWVATPLWNRGFTWAAGTSITVPESGLYEIKWDVTFVPGAGLVRLTWATLSNDATHRWGQHLHVAHAATTDLLSSNATVNIPANVTITINVFHDAGVNLNIAGASDFQRCECSVTKIGQFV